MTHKRPFYLVLGCMTMLLGGLLYAWSILKAPFSEAFGWSSSALALNFTIMMCCFCLGGLISGRLARRFPVAVPLTIAGILAAAGFCLTANLHGRILELYLSYGCLGGLGIGMMYNAVITTVSGWFPEKKGIVTGALMMCYGASTMVFGPLAAKLLKSLGWRKTYLCLGVTVGCIFLSAAVMLATPPHQSGTDSQTPVKDRWLRRGEIPPQKLVQDPFYWVFFLCMVAMASVCNVVVSFASDYALSLGVSAGTATALVGILSVSNGLGRVIGGKLIDSFGCWKTLLLAHMLTLAAPLLSILAILVGSVPMAVTALCVTGLSGGFSPTLSASFTAAAFGSRNFPVNFGISNLVMVPASFMATLAALLVRDGSYLRPCLLLLVCAVLSLCLNRLLRKLMKNVPV